MAIEMLRLYLFTLFLFVPACSFSISKVNQWPGTVSSLQNRPSKLIEPYSLHLNNVHQLHAVTRCDNYASYVRRGRRWGGWIGPVIRYLNNAFIVSLFKIILTVLNKFTVIRRKDLFRNIDNRPKSQGLLTISNHQSIQDDPGLFAAMLPFTRLRSKKLRWVLCTEDVFFYRKWLQSILAAGNVLPLERSGSLEQPMFQVFKEILENGAWCHIFPEGRIWQSWRFGEGEAILGPFKVGVGKLIAHSKTTPLVLPFYHSGMDKVVPEKQLADKKSRKPAKPQSIFPKLGNDIRVYIGKPIDFTEKINAFKQKYPDALRSWQATTESLALYAEIANELRDAMLELEAEARRGSSK